MKISNRNVDRRVFNLFLERSSTGAISARARVPSPRRKGTWTANDANDGTAEIHSRAQSLFHVVFERMIIRY